MQSAKPARIEFIHPDGTVLLADGQQPFLYPNGYDVDPGTCQELAQRCFRTALRVGNPIVDFVRVVTEDGQEICRWSKDDEVRATGS